MHFTPLTSSRLQSMYGLWRRHIDPPMGVDVRSMWGAGKQTWNGPEDENADRHLHRLSK